MGRREPGQGPAEGPGLADPAVVPGSVTTGTHGASRRRTTRGRAAEMLPLAKSIAPTGCRGGGTMYKSIAATAGLAVVLATAAPAQAQTSAGRTMSGAAKRVALKVKSSGGTSVKARCRAPKRGRSICRVTFLASDGRRCADTRVTVGRRNGRMTVKGFAPACKLAPTPGTPEQPPVEGVPEAVETPAEMPGPPDTTTGGSPLFDPGAGVPGGPPPGAESLFDRPPGAPVSAKRTAI